MNGNRAQVEFLMFRKRVKKEYPPETFIPTPARVLAILQLCLAFTVLLWTTSQPFLEELFAIKSRLGVYQYVMGGKSSPHLQRFAELDIARQMHVKGQYEAMRAELDRSFLSKLTSSIKAFFWGMNPYKQAWVALSILIPIFLLKKVEGGIAIVWLLPLLTAAYALDNRWYGVPSIDYSAQFYPSETKVLEYLGEPLKGGIAEQRDQLQRGLERYFIMEWAKETPSTNNEQHTQQVERGDFYFHLALLDSLYRDWQGAKHPVQRRDSLLILALYLLWNFSLACGISYYLSPKQKHINSNPCRVTYQS